MILLAHEKLSVPVTCKIRVFPEIDKTVRYAQMLEKAGCQLLTVHGRTKEQKGPLSGAASWEHIKAVRKAVAIPVFANGNIQCLQDVERCLRDTGVQGVMSAEGNLHNPALFEGRSPAVWELAEEYLDIVREHPCPLSYVRAHLFKLWHHTLQVHQELREELAKVKTLEGIAAVSQELKLRCQEEISRQEGAKPTGDLPFHWICQPYIRPGPREGSKEKAGARSKRALEEEECGTEVLSKNKQKKQLRNPHKTFDPSLKPKYAKCDQCGNPKVSGFRLHATKASALGVGRVVSALLGVAGLVPAQLGLQRGSRWHDASGRPLASSQAPAQAWRGSESGWVGVRERHLAWEQFPGLHPGRGHLAEASPVGLLPCWPDWPREWCWPQAPEIPCAQGNRCVFSLCRGCCKKRASKETADCPGHGLLFKTKLEKSLAWKEAQPELQEPQPAAPGTPGGFSEVMGSALA
ncbi:DUS1L isoform 6 [Pan troglodytes]|nr:DUS1L isoform 6 [Pan troglodytes]